MKNKKLFKSLTTSALILTSAMAFSSSAFAAPAVFDQNDEAGNPNSLTTITNTRNTMATLTFKKVFKGGGYTGWTDRKTKDTSLADFDDASKFKTIFTLKRGFKDSSGDITWENTVLDINNSLSDNNLLESSYHNYYKVEVTKTDEHDNTDGTDTITYTIKIDADDDNGKSYVFGIEENSTAAPSYYSEHKAK